MGHADVIRDYVIDNFLFGDANGLKDDTSFLDEGIVDSTGIIELVAFVEKSFNIEVEDDDIVPENFDSIANIAGFLEKKLAS
jgi:acyl carrier protein